MGSSNYNIWYLKQDAVDENDDTIDLPFVVCDNCLSEKHVVNFSTSTCKKCNNLMPSNIDPVSFKGVHSVVDTNYIQWPICNTCANNNWKTSLTCICGKICHESDMIQIGTGYLTQYVNKKSNSICWHILNAIAPANNDENIGLNINKLCRGCSTVIGNPTTQGREAFENLLDDDHWNFDNHPLSNSNIVHYDDVNNTEIEVYPSPSIVSYIKNQNFGNIGYAIQYSQLF